MNTDRTRQLDDLYASIRAKGMDAFLAGGAVDDWLNHPDADTRMAVALVIRPAEAVRQRIRCTLDRLQADFPELYCYPASDLHITVLDILRGRPGLEKPSPALLAQYNACLCSAAVQLPAFSIQFRGLTLSDGAIMVKGYDDGGLEALRSSLRPALRAAGLPLEERYETFSCHITAARFPQKQLFRYRHRADLPQLVRQPEGVSFCNPPAKRFVRLSISFRLLRAISYRSQNMR